MKLKREQTLLGFKEPRVPTYCYNVLPRSLLKAPEPSLGLGLHAYKVHVFGTTTMNFIADGSLGFLHKSENI